MASPIIKKDQVSMSFSEALKQMVDGNKATRVEWGDDNIYGFIKEGILTLHKEGKDFSWIVSDGDILATDWILLNSLN